MPKPMMFTQITFRPALLPEIKAVDDWIGFEFLDFPSSVTMTISAKKAQSLFMAAQSAQDAIRKADMECEFREQFEACDYLMELMDDSLEFIRDALDVDQTTFLRMIARS